MIRIRGEFCSSENLMYFTFGTFGDDLVAQAAHGAQSG